MILGQRYRGRAAVSTATCGTVLIAAAAFWLSFTALSDLARRSGVARGQAWAWPLIIDGMILVATVAAVALDREPAAWYPWSLLSAATAVSVTANTLHAQVDAGLEVPGTLAACVAAVPPLVLLASTHLTVVLVRSHGTQPAADPAAEPTAIDEHAQAASAADVDAAIRSDALAVTASGGRHDLAARLRRGGWSNKQIARHLSVAPSTVGRWFAKTETTAEPAPEGENSMPKELTP